MKKISFLLLFILILVYSCKEDNIIIPYSGDNPFTFNKARIELKTYENNINIGYVTINLLGNIKCDSIRISYDGFARDYRFTGSISNDSSISIIITPLDSAVNSKLKFTAKQSFNMLTGNLWYCENSGNCEYAEIGHIVGFYNERYEGYYYSPLFFGEFQIFPL